MNGGGEISEEEVSNLHNLRKMGWSPGSKIKIKFINWELINNRWDY